ncbi:MAG: hypothetical protein IJ972_03530, partial [Campylobacter sp.]|nr:hypothetical protein [Campylobacter sp.]
MITAFYNGVSGVKTAEFGHSTIGNDISNINTVGYKSSTAEFKSLFYSTLAGASSSPVNSQIGLGSTKMATSLNFTQGNLHLILYTPYPAVDYSNLGKLTGSIMIPFPDYLESH